MKYCVCNCFYELKLSYGIISIKNLISKGFGFRYVTSVKNDCCYICCRETIIFLFQCYRNFDFDFYVDTDDPVVKSDNEDIYLMSEKTLYFHFSSILNLTYNEPV